MKNVTTENLTGLYSVIGSPEPILINLKLCVAGKSQLEKNPGKIVLQQGQSTLDFYVKGTTLNVAF
jgi:hypothetical protein